MRPVFRVGRNFWPAFRWFHLETRYEYIVERFEDRAVVIVRFLWWYAAVGYAK